MAGKRRACRSKWCSRSGWSSRASLQPALQHLREAAEAGFEVDRDLAGIADGAADLLIFADHQRAAGGEIVALWGGGGEGFQPGGDAIGGAGERALPAGDAAQAFDRLA